MLYDEPIEEIYFRWLYSKMVHTPVATPSNSYWTLFRDLHAVEFIWNVIGDDNRAEEGILLRRSFVREAMLPSDPPWLSIGCSVLEMLIAFADRASFETDWSPEEWFWRFLENLGLSDCNDSSNGVTRRVSRVLDTFIWRTYSPNGRGGMFPLETPQHDQREVEIWYQFCEYLVEQDIV